MKKKIKDKNNHPSASWRTLSLKRRGGKKQPPVVLAILDGWGINHDYIGNAITRAKTPTYKMLLEKFPNTKLRASGRAVGLPPTQDGNSEAGHLNLGAGRVVEQDTVIISKLITAGTFFKNPALKASIKQVKKYKSKVHLMGLLSGWESAHTDPDHLLALLTFYRQEGIKKVYLHLFTDGRDSFQYGALKFLKQLENEFKDGEVIASVTGRYYAMDRTKKWERTEAAYNALVLGKGQYYAKSAEEAIKRAYDRDETDEFILPTVIVKDGKCDKRGICISGEPIAKIEDNDAVVFFNLRSDRSRQLSKVFVQKNFNDLNPGAFKRTKVLKNLLFVAMTDFGPDLDTILSISPSQDVKETLPMALTGLRQLYIAETEKYVHVTYFFNGGYAEPVNKEERLMVSSPDVSSYDKIPEMSAKEITDIILNDLKNNKYDFILVNYANPDMVGHTGNLAAGIKACGFVDGCLGKLYEEIKNKKGMLLVVADHGNAEEMIDEKTGEIDTQHSSYPVPFIIADLRDGVKRYKLRKDGILGNVAPTILDLLNKKKPKEMTEGSLVL
ncbi:MAG: 2,3-bisphosphoglycerate-independent phosphoglycerate mutase [Patescibacteria group bacterium]|nr:2,3-bisphosphoglycerate-independent phosphoglycerate mutase [Patescibacteria group bacterium]